MTEREYNRIRSAHYRERNRDQVNAKKREYYARDAERINAAKRAARAR
ncbi:MAG TPA: hypothetical protein VF638_00880 [Sphingomonas sp.]|jgi:hypothetical protein